MTGQKTENNKETIYFGGGCFWGIEEYFLNTKGVTETEVGYMGGTTTNPSYEEVCTDLTGHIEVVKVVFDPSKVTVNALLDKFWMIHDPTQEDGQGPDYGTQYRTAIFYTTDAQKKIAEESKLSLEKSKRHSDPIATLIKKAPEFYKAEDYHQKYLMKRGKHFCH